MTKLDDKLKKSAEAECRKYGLTLDQYNEIADFGDAQRKTDFIRLGTARRSEAEAITQAENFEKRLMTGGN